jgi:hypothetical protein
LASTSSFAAFRSSIGRSLGWIGFVGFMAWPLSRRTRIRRPPTYQSKYGEGLDQLLFPLRWRHEYLLSLTEFGRIVATLELLLAWISMGW